MTVEIQLRGTDWARQLSCTPYAFMSTVLSQTKTASQATTPGHGSDSLAGIEERAESTTHTTVDPSRCYILQLPYELRQEIYIHLLTRSEHPSHSSPYNHKLYPQILSTCTAIHDEALPVLYTTNTFLAHASLLASFPRLHPSSPPVSTARLAALVTRIRVQVRLDAGAAFSNSRAERELTGLDEVTVECRQAAYGEAGPQVLRLFEGVRGVRRARVVGSTTGFEDYARWLEGVMGREKGSKVEAYRWPRGENGDDDHEREAAEDKYYFGPLGKNVKWDGCNFVM